MTATHTFDVFPASTGYGSASGNWTRCSGKQGPEFLDHRFALSGEEQWMVLGAEHLRQFVRVLGPERRGVRGE